MKGGSGKCFAISGSEGVHAKTVCIRQHATAQDGRGSSTFHKDIVNKHMTSVHGKATTSFRLLKMCPCSARLSTETVHMNGLCTTDTERSSKKKLVAACEHCRPIDHPTT